MIIKGSSRGQDERDVERLVTHLLSDENEAVEVVEVSDTVATTLGTALHEMRALSLGTRTRKPLYHASISLDRTEAHEIDAGRWIEAADELGRRLGLDGHQRALILHSKSGRPHLHVVWNRVDVATLKCASDSNSYQRHEQCARALEATWGLREVVGVHSRRPGTPRPVAAATHSDWQASVRTGVSVGSVAVRIREAWDASRDGHAFVMELEKRSLCLANGRRGVVAVDEVGTPHSIGRRLCIRAAEVRRKLADIDVRRLPSVESAKAGTKRVYNLEGGRRMRGRMDLPGIAPAWDNATPPDWEALERYWGERGYQAEKRWDGLWVWAEGIWIADYGNRIVIHSEGMPTDQQILATIQAGKARGWLGIRFFGSEEFQQRARVLAIQHGLFHPEDIHLDCEQGKGGAAPPPKDPMPDHVRKSLGLPDPNAPPCRRGDRPGQERPGRRESRRHRETRGPKPGDVPVTADDVADLGLDEASAGHGLD